MHIQSKKTQRILQAGLIVSYFLLATLMFMIGRTHSVLIDNKTSTNGKYKALSKVECLINGTNATEYFGGERDKIEIRGQRIRIQITPFSGGEPLIKDLFIPLMDDAVLISLPMIYHGAPENPVSPFDLYK